MKNNPSILLIEDDLELLDLIASYLNMNGYEVKKASNAMEALDSANDDIQLIISDFCLPKKNGANLVQEISQNLNHTPDTIFLTGYGEEIIDKITLSTPFVVLSKPINFNKLLNAIEHSMGSLIQTAA